jgi:DNA mismatch endonuclease (patch repair protein)
MREGRGAQARVEVARATLGPGRLVRVASGVDVPYPEPSSEAATKIGKANRRVSTKPELAVRSELHRRGLRFRRDFLVRAGGARARVDVVFTKRRLAVFVDGCFWHTCPDHFHMPKSNLEYWEPKLRANVERDRRIDSAFESDGWEVLRVWEHEGLASAGDRIEERYRAAPFMSHPFRRFDS